MATTQQRLCTVDGCAMAYRALGYCNKHYRRFRKYGTATPDPHFTKEWYNTPSGTKRCSGCSQIKPLSEFYINNSSDAGAHKRQGNCKTCCRNNHLASTYGLSLVGFNALLASQDNGCAICGHDGSTLRFHVDHDHSTGAIRGILCSACNTGIGFLKDDVITVRAAAQYLERSTVVSSNPL